MKAVADWYRFDEPDFEGWLTRVRQRVPGLFPATVVFAKDEADMVAKIGDADALVVEGFAVGEAELAGAKRLRIVQKFGGLAGNIDAAACHKRGISVSVQRRRVNIAVAEQAMALMLALAKARAGVERNRHRGGAAPGGLRTRRRSIGAIPAIPTSPASAAFRTLASSVLGIVGMGEIGREIAARAAAFGMRVLYHQRRRINPIDEGTLGARHVGLDELMEASDFITPALPLDPSTRGLIGAAQLRRVKPGAILVNVARGELVDHDALIAALESGRLGGFALDVGYQEPTPPDERLLKFRDGNVILMPHNRAGRAAEQSQRPRGDVPEAMARDPTRPLPGGAGAC